MQDANTPLKLGTVWGVSAAAPYITYPVPTPSQTGVTNGAASFTDGFPPNTFVPLSGGGAGPFGKDFNGLLKQITAGVQWLQAGGPIPFDASFSTAVGGYPQGAIIASSVTLGLLWLNLVDNNTTNPDAGGANWRPIGGQNTFNQTTVTFSSTQSWTVLVTGWHEIEAWGGGGGGGAGDNASLGGSGAGGGLYAKTRAFLTVGQVLDITIGAGGAGTAAAGNGGQPGGSTTVTVHLGANLLTAGGGLGGPAAGGNGGAGGSTHSGDAYSILGGGGFVSQAFGVYGAPGGNSPLGGFGGMQGNGGGIPGGGAAGNQFNNFYTALQLTGGRGQARITYVTG